MKKFLFANPFQPELCPHLWLAVYLSTHDIGLDTNNALFPGNHTASRIGKALQQLIKSVVDGGGPHIQYAVIPYCRALQYKIMPISAE